MATSNGADFATQAYRHGVLIGNWNEDQYGCDLLNPTLSCSLRPSSSHSYNSPHNPSFQSTSSSTFTQAGADIVRRGVWEEKSRLRATQEVDRGLLFAHRGAPAPERRWHTSYGASYCAPADQTRVDATVAKLSGYATPAAAPSSGLEDDAVGGRARSYRTSHSDSFNPRHSLMALQGDQGAEQLRNTSAAARSGALSASLEANWRKMRLRKD